MTTTMCADKTLPQVLAELELCSHVSAVNLNPSSRDAGEDIGGKRPPGGVDGKEDRYREPGRSTDHERVLRSAAHFRGQLERGRSPVSVLREAEDALAAWRRQPAPVNPEYGSPQWKRWVAESALSGGELARMFGVTRQYIQQIRSRYGVAA